MTGRGLTPAATLRGSRGEGGGEQSKILSYSWYTALPHWDRIVQPVSSVLVVVSYAITAQILIGRCNVTVCINATGHWTCSPVRPPAATARCSNTALPGVATVGCTPLPGRAEEVGSAGCLGPGVGSRSQGSASVPCTCSLHSFQALKHFLPDWSKERQWAPQPTPGTWDDTTKQ